MSSVHKRTTLDICDVCGPGSRAVQKWMGAWFGCIWLCECGDRFHEEGRSERPFRRGWRKKAQAEFEEMWESALSDLDYNARTHADVQLVLADMRADREKSGGQR